ncbi:MAG: hypothetical protein IKN57_03120 [Parasporobacterium sp.]|nr:hypothetical protein [Parasporobacterium sp.]
MLKDQYFNIYQQTDATAEWIRSERIAYCDQPLSKGNGFARMMGSVVRTLLSVLF